LPGAAGSRVRSDAAEGGPIAGLLNGSHSCHYCCTIDRNSSTEAPKFKSQENASYVLQKRWMSFARKASRDALEICRRSTSKRSTRFAIFAFAMVGAICIKRHAPKHMRVQAYCWLSVMQCDQCLCITEQAPTRLAICVVARHPGAQQMASACSGCGDAASTEESACCLPSAQATLLRDALRW
jgi:hypothetical protein